ncbi:FRG domain-containing protein [Inconstantimicrobium mannanitabidum]|uniref:FRG domain-containing protein n=1 Tax=Inconstantimicrobium mannanitabidum TaxID=1604901 RepID=A0ACB5RE78_9CLOT|nr:FRG domain-containing protein [Clostridium sp. TW13]GKX67406.1 FRG domain-containing protein [Clostridium sp. TW13]
MSLQNLRDYTFKNGILTIKVSSFDEFQDIIDSDYFNTKNQNFIYRGQGNIDWLIETSINRIIKTPGSYNPPNVLQYQLENFKYSIRGRRGANPEVYRSNIEWWALGQHYGLATPMLDFSYAPYVATFFAYEEDRTSDRLVACLNYKLLRDFYESNQIDENQRIFILKPFMDDNPRLIAQSGLLAYIPLNTDLESLIAQYFPNCNDLCYCDPVLIKFQLPNTERVEALKTLQKMNITDATIYPDLQGSSLYCNMKLRIAEY